MTKERQAMTPAEFDHAKRKLEALFPELHQSSGRRSVAGNEKAGGHPMSKHLIGMAADYGWGQSSTVRVFIGVRELGLRYTPYNWGVHIQGLPPGKLPDWWRDKYAPDWFVELEEACFAGEGK